MATIIKKINLPNKTLNLLILLIMGDLFYIGLHIVHKVSRILNVIDTLQYNDVFALYYDLSLGESFQYLKEYWIIIVFLWLIFRQRQGQYMGWVLLFIYLLLDDMLGFHEGLATFALRNLNIDPKFILTGELRYQDFGELGVSVFFGVILFGLIGIAYLRGSSDVRRTFHYLFAGLAIIVFFGVVNDFLNRIFSEEGSKVLFELTRLIEESGEMLGMSLTCWFVNTLLASTSDNQNP